MRTPSSVRSLRRLIVLGLAALTSAWASDVDSLARILRDPDRTAEAKGEACLQLMDMGPAAAPAVLPLVALLNSPDEMLRDYAVTTLERIGPAARNALPALRRTAARDASQEIRELARSAIAKIGGGAPAPEPVGAPVAPAPETGTTESQAQEKPAIPEPGPGEEKPRPAPTLPRPPLELHEGRFFRWAVPAGWTGSDAATGVTLTAPNGLMSVSSALLLHQPGQTTPADLTLWMLGQIPENRSLQMIAKKDLPDQPSGLGAPWKVQELDMRYTVNGIPVHAVWTTGIVSMGGLYDAYLIGYQCTPGAFDRARLWLAPVAHSIAVSNPVQVAGNDKFLVPSNAPIDNPALTETWRGKGHSEERISMAQRRGMMGYERAKDLETGRVFEMPLEAWDGAAGGYRDPLRPEEVLQNAAPGE